METLWWAALPAESQYLSTRLHGVMSHSLRETQTYELLYTPKFVCHVTVHIIQIPLCIQPLHDVITHTHTCMHTTHTSASAHLKCINRNVGINKS